MRPTRFAGTSLFVIMGVCGCGGDPQPAPPPQAQTPPPSETDKLRAASAIGYDGEALKRSVDTMQKQAGEQAAATDAAGRDTGQ